MGLLSSWMPSWLPSWADSGALLRKFAAEIVSKGHTPRHVAFIMDGNRRFARRTKVETIVAHSMGFETLKNVCLPLKEHRGAFSC
jgi:undecaprenyl pyrophosphate synthase